MQCNQLCLLFLWTIHFKTSTIFSLQSKEERLLLTKSANWTGTAVTIYCETAHVSQLAKWLPEASFILFTTQVTCSVQPVPLNSKQWGIFTTQILHFTSFFILFQLFYLLDKTTMQSCHRSLNKTSHAKDHIKFRFRSTGNFRGQPNES